MQTKRVSAVNGSFYPKECSKVEIYFQKFNSMIDANVKSNSIFSVVPRAIIAPHAGYIYSGFTANMAYKILSNSRSKRVIVIGPSHHHYFEGISGSYFEKYETPCGDIDIDTDYLIDLAKKFKIGFEPKAHNKEHSTEVQMPFIKYYLSQSSVLELIYGKVTPEYLSKIITYLLKDIDNIVVISSDLSHFYDEQKARRVDKLCLSGIATLDNQKLDEGCEACGLLGIKGMIISAKQLNLRSKLIDYRTSSDYSGDSSSVVGYASAIFY